MWWLVIALAIPAFAFDVTGRLLQISSPSGLIRPQIVLASVQQFVVPAIQLAGLGWFRVPRPFTHGVWVGAFSGIAWIIAGLLWLMAGAIRHETFTGFAYAAYFLFALPWEALYAFILGALAALLMRVLPPRRSKDLAAPPTPAPSAGVR